MRIAQVLAGISLAEADVLRKAVGKKDPELIRLELGKFVEKAVAPRLRPRRSSRDIAAQIETFGRYGFNQVARGRVLDPLVPHRVAQDALSRRLHGRAAVVADRRHRRGREVHQ